MKYFHVEQNEIDEKLFNIFVGISLGNKLLTTDMVKHYVKWAHEKSQKNAVILIADKIDTVNWEVFRGLSREEALIKTEQKGYGIAGMFDKAKRTLARETGDMGYISRVHIIFWDDIINVGYVTLRNILEKEYWANSAFQEKVLYFVDKYVALREVNVTPEQRHKLAAYIIDELPTLVGGILWDKTLYNLILYPTYVDSGMSEFVLDIRNGKYFDSSKLSLRQICVMVEDFIVKPDISFSRP
jgi:tRNA-dependent cyclodipeptide synthase